MMEQQKCTIVPKSATKRIVFGLIGLSIVVVVSLTPVYISSTRSSPLQIENAVYPAVLYVWSGQDIDVLNAADFVAIIDFNESSSTYGSILNTKSLISDPIRKVKQAGNEPHHSAISSNGKYYITGGLLSFLSQDKEIFVWRIPQNPLNGPEFLYAIDGPGACPDEFLPIGDNQFIVSMMCSESATSPGDMLLIDADARNFTSILKNGPALQDFNPHGFTRLSNGSLLVADYIDPITLVGNDSSKIIFRNTVRHFLPDGTLQRTIRFYYSNETRATSGLGQGIGFMEVKAIPNDPLGRAYACGTNTNIIYLCGPGMPEPLAVLDASQINGFMKRPSSGIISITSDGKRMLLSFQLRFIVLLDISQPIKPTFLHVFDFCSDAALKNISILIRNKNQSMSFTEFCIENHNITGTHVIVHPIGEIRFLVINYFLKFGLAQFSGTRTIHSFKFNKDLTNFTYDARFNPNFDPDEMNKQGRNTFYSLNSYPHHLQYIKL